MLQAKKGDTVKVHYTGRFEDNTIFDSSNDREPLQFIIGANHVISGFENAVIGMSVNEIKTIMIPFSEAYGPHRSDMVLEVPIGKLPSNLHPEIGQQLGLMQPNGHEIIVTITNITDSLVTLDANHPLAGKNLIFDIKLMEIL